MYTIPSSIRLYRIPWNVLIFLGLPLLSTWMYLEGVTFYLIETYGNEKRYFCAVCKHLLEFLPQFQVFATVALSPYTAGHSAPDPQGCHILTNTHHEQFALFMVNILMGMR